MEEQKTNQEVHVSVRKGIQDSALGTRNLIMIVALAIIGCIFIIPLSYFNLAMVTTPLGVFVSAAFMGLWIIPYVLPCIIVQRPGATIIAGFIMGVVCLFTLPLGPMGIVSNLIGASLVGIPFFLTWYRFWSKKMYFFSGIVFGLFNGIMYLMLVGRTPKGEIIEGAKSTLTVGWAIGIVGISILSALLGIVIALVIRFVLCKAGISINKPFVRVKKKKA